MGNHGIKASRRRVPVNAGPGGVVADHVPFYLAPRSPMMYAIHMGNVASYAGGIDPLVYLVSSIGRLLELGLPVVTTDRHDALATASHGEEDAGLALWSQSRCSLSRAPRIDALETARGATGRRGELSRAR